jgi:hypothetical protein
LGPLVVGRFTISVPSGGGLGWEELVEVCAKSAVDTKRKTTRNLGIRLKLIPFLCIDH